MVEGEVASLAVYPENFSSQKSWALKMVGRPSLAAHRGRARRPAPPDLKMLPSEREERLGQGYFFLFRRFPYFFLATKMLASMPLWRCSGAGKPASFIHSATSPKV
jgi:hypothetical protein